ncbi:MAG: trigger factor [Blastocatellia bacterium]
MKLEVAVTDVSPSHKELTIEVHADEVKAEFEKTYLAYTRHVKVPGFRPGRVPRSVIKQRFNKDIRGEVLSNLLPHALSHAIQDHNIRAVGEPDINPDEISISDGEPLRFKAGIDVVPDFEIHDHKGVKLTRRVVRVTDEEVNKLIDYWRESSAEFAPVENRPSQNGDFVSVNLIGKFINQAEEPEAEAPEDLKSDDVEIEIGGQGVQDDFNTALTGVIPGDTREFRVAYPADFTSKGLAGKTLDFTASVIAVRIKELPELTDEIAKEFGPYDGIEDMRSKVRENLIKQSETRADNRVKDDLITSIITEYNFEIPTKILKKQRESRSQQFIHRIINSGLPMEQLMNIDIKKELKRIEHQVERELRASIVFERIADNEGLTVTEQEVRAEISARAAAAGTTEAEIIERLTKDDALSSIEFSVLHNKTLEHLLAAAEVTVEEVSAEEAAKYEEIADEIATEDEPDDIADSPERLGDGVETPETPAGSESNS